MTDLTELQRTLLTAAAASADTCAVRPDEVTPTQWKAATAPLTKAGWLISIPQEGGASKLMITDAGRGLVSPPAAKRRVAKTTKAASPPAPGPRADDARPSVPAAASSPKGKIGILVDLLRRDGGATVADMMAATGWQAHSVRGAMSGSLKKSLGLTVTSNKTEAGRVYRIVEAA